MLSDFLFATFQMRFEPLSGETSEKLGRVPKMKPTELRFYCEKIL